jgi:hypothetical protein
MQARKTVGLLAFLAALALVGLVGCAQEATPTRVPSVTPYPTRSATPTPTSTPDVTGTLTPSSTPSGTPTGPSTTAGEPTLTFTPHPLELPACQVFKAEGAGSARGALAFPVGSTGLRSTQPAPLPTAPIATPRPRAAGEPITPENVPLLEPLVVILPGLRLNDLIYRDASEMLSVGYTDRISRWDTRSGRELGAYRDGREGAGALSVALSPDGALIATGGGAWDNGVRLLDVASGEARALGVHEDIVVSVAFSPQGTWLASGDNGDQVKIWDVASGSLFRTLKGDAQGMQERFSSLYWVSEGTLLAAGATAIYRWDVDSGELLARRAIPEGVDFIVEAAFGQGGNRVAAAAQDDAVYVSQRPGGAWETWPAPPSGGVSSVAFAADQGLLAAGTFGGQMLLWDVGTGELLLGCSGPTDAIVRVRFGPEGRTVAALGWDASIWLWGVP